MHAASSIPRSFEQLDMGRKRKEKANPVKRTNTNQDGKKTQRKRTDGFVRVTFFDKKCFRFWKVTHTDITASCLSSVQLSSFGFASGSSILDMEESVFEG